MRREDHLLHISDVNFFLAEAVLRPAGVHVYRDPPVGPGPEYYGFFPKADSALEFCAAIRRARPGVTMYALYVGPPQTKLEVFDDNGR
jgi:hypothetical protein